MRRALVIFLIAIPAILLWLLVGVWGHLAFGAPAVPFIGFACTPVPCTSPSVFISAGAFNFDTLFAGADKGNAFRIYGNSLTIANHIGVTSEATGFPPSVFAEGTDSNLQLNIESQNQGHIYIGSCTSGACASSVEWVDIFGPANAVNQVQLNGASAGNPPSVVTLGTDSNITLNLGGKGTGFVFATDGLAVPVVAIGSLPSCAAGQEGLIYAVNNGVANPTYNATVSTTGSTHILVYCNGTNWTYH